MTSPGEITVNGFIVHSLVQATGRGGPRGSRLALLGRLEDGRTFAVVISPYRPFFFVRASDANALSGVAGATAGAERRTMDGEEVVRVECETIADLRQADRDLRARAIRTYEADLSPADAPLVERHIHGSLSITGTPSPGHHVDLVFMNPRIEPAEWDPELSVLSIDIETDPRTEEILAVALVGTNPYGEATDEVLFSGPAVNDPRVRSFASEAELLSALVVRIAGIDPDIITGWNVIDFDFGVISRRLQHYRIAFSIARSDEAAQFLGATQNEGGRRGNAAVSCHGRQVIDALRLVRYGPQRFDDRKLGSVAQAVLGETKLVEAETSSEKIRTLLALYRDDPASFCEYCRKDAELVLRILDATGLLALTIKRCRLIGIGLNRAWTSIPAFEFLYLEAMHDRGLVGPTLGVDALPQGEVAGGAIIKPQPGLFANVLVFDFKSLYPSIIRTFGIDPVGYLDTEEGYPEGADPPPHEPEAITAPNGARFSRNESILPAVIDRFWENRDEAKRRGDTVASYVYKIIMNSFYGVLGASGCRFAGAPLAGAITGFGQYILHWAKDRFTEQGLRVLYGDTDSLFVLADEHASPGELLVRGAELARALNETLAAFVESAFGVETRLELEFEKVYRRFYLPRIRHGAGGHGASGPAAEVRGRAKGYAGLTVAADGSDAAVEIKGMEAIRTDWTRAAADLQRELIDLVFADADPDRIVARIRETIRALRDGELDDRLVYSRRLRKSIDSYTSSRPPHVQAASLLPPDEREGMIDYLITAAGPQPPSRRTSPIDHDHYLERQIRPIAEPICEILGIQTGELFDPTQQLSLF